MQIRADICIDMCQFHLIPEESWLQTIMWWPFTFLTDKPLGFVVRMADERTYALKSVLTSSKENDLAVLQLETNGKFLPALPLAEGAKVGEKVFVMGHPKGMHYFFSQRNVMDKYLEEAGEPNKKLFREMVVISADMQQDQAEGL